MTGVEGLTLEAADGASPTIDSTSLEERTVKIDADDVTVSGLELQTDAGTEILRTGTDVEGVIVADNVFIEGDRAGAANFGAEATFEDNVVEDDVRLGFIGDTGILTVEDNVINAEETGISHQGTVEPDEPRGDENAVLVATGNEIDVANDGFELFDTGGRGVDFTITDNTIDNAENGINDVNDAIDDDDVTIENNVFNDVTNEIVNFFQ